MNTFQEWKINLSIKQEKEIAELLNKPQTPGKIMMNKYGKPKPKPKPRPKSSY